MTFGIESQQELEQAIEIANRIQKAIPEGAVGGQVFMAMTLLMATSIKTAMPTDEHDGALAHVIQVMEDVFSGRVVTAFRPDN